MKKESDGHTYMVVAIIILLFSAYFAVYSYMALSIIAVVPLIISAKRMKKNKTSNVIILCLSAFLLIFGLYGLFIGLS